MGRSAGIPARSNHSGTLHPSQHASGSSYRVPLKKPTRFLGFVQASGAADKVRIRPMRMPFLACLLPKNVKGMVCPLNCFRCRVTAWSPHPCPSPRGGRCLRQPADRPRVRAKAAFQNNAALPSTCFLLSASRPRHVAAHNTGGEGYPARRSVPTMLRLSRHSPPSHLLGGDRRARSGAGQWTAPSFFVDFSFPAIGMGCRWLSDHLHRWRVLLSRRVGNCWQCMHANARCRDGSASVSRCVSAVGRNRKGQKVPRRIWRLTCYYTGLG